jgi:16S rRNA (adenine1518-N6/adenine1519-N6)-dimethyltransferase
MNRAAEESGFRAESVLARLKSAGIEPRRSLGQNFLHDRHLLEEIVAAASIGPDDSVFEVGTGPATLTRPLAERSRRVVTVEIDPRLAEFAREELSSFPHVEVLTADVLSSRTSLEPAIAERLAALGSFIWVSNLPYQVASSLIVVMLESRLAWRSAVLTLQKEVADRLVALPGTPAYGPLGLLVRYWADARIVRNLKPGSFWPRPGVDSAVIELRPRSERLEESVQKAYPSFRAWVRCLFRSRRKQLQRILRDQLGAERVAEALAVGPWQGDERVDRLTMDDVRRLSAAIPIVSIDGEPEDL